MNFDRSAIRKETLAHLLRFAELCPIYARQAAQRYEKNAPSLFDGLANRFDKDWSVMKAAKEKANATPA